MKNLQEVDNIQQPGAIELNDESPGESKGLESGTYGNPCCIGGYTTSLDAEWAKLVSNSSMTRYELEVLASYHLDLGYYIQWVSKAYGDSQSYWLHLLEFASKRLGIIEELLGKKSFEETTREIHAAQQAHIEGGLGGHANQQIMREKLRVGPQNG